MKNQVSNLTKQVLSLIVTINKMSFVGLTYTNKAGEKASYTVGVNFSYPNAIVKDLDKLNNANIENLTKLVQFPKELVEKAVNKLTTSFINNQNKETQSNQSKGQQDAYINIFDGIKIHKDTQEVKLYGMKIQKTIIEKGIYKPKNSRDLTLCQNAIKKALNFTTSKYRMFSITLENFHQLNANKINLNFE
ncbi:MAG: hypothetical protein ACTSYR_04060 [Candidatus Odinarchaeia archaeon]